MSDINRKTGDTTPLTGTLTANGEPVDLSQARAAYFHMRAGDENGEVVATGEADIVNDNGTVRYHFDAEEVEDAGFYVAEWEVEYADYTRQSFPNSGYFSLVLAADLQ